ncbi:CoA-binding protein [Chloroflexota bacterium]
MSPTDESGNSLEALFTPHSIAVVGASANPRKQGYRYMKQLLDFGFKGTIYPVNSRGGEILGHKAYSSVSVIPGPVDYVISTVPAEHVPQLIHDCARKGVKILQLYTAQLSETGIPERKQLEEHIVSLARQAGVRLLGPNCMGIYRPDIGLTFRFTSSRVRGDVAFISQSAGHAAEVMYRGSLRGLGFSKIISYGNAADINEAELLDYVGRDASTRIIIAYIEGVRSPDFPRVLKAVARRKPVVIFKVGRTEAGARAAVSHTGSLTGNYAIWKGLVEQCRAISVASLEELVDTAIAFAKLPLPEGRNVGAIGAGGGGSILSADEFELNGLRMPPMPQKVLDEAKTFLGDDWVMVKNPVDSSVILPAGWGYEEIKRIFRIIAEHPLYQILVGDAGEWRPDHKSEIPDYQTMVGLLLETREVTEKPMGIVLRPADHTEEWRRRVYMEQQQRCISEGAAIFPSVGRAARALGKFVSYHLMPRE